MFDIVVFASGRGSNFRALLEAERHNELPIRIRALLSDKPQSTALQIARGGGIEAIALDPRAYPDRASFDCAMFAKAAEFHPDLIVLAGYMRMIDAAIIGQWRGKAINIHPSLLPKYPGLHTHQRVLEAADATHGASVHFVTAELDGGPVIAQVELPIRPGDTIAALAARVLALEHRLLIAAVGLLAQKRVTLGTEGVVFDDRRLTAPLQLAQDGTLTA